MSAGRKLAGAPILVQDWDDDESKDEERAALFWELFLDLLLVAAATSVAEVLEEDRTLSGLSEFAVLYFTMINGWFLYTHHVTARFEDSTLLHSFVFFFYLLGMACCIVNASYETASAFAIGASLQRVVVVIILGVVAYHIPRARAFCGSMMVLTGLTTACFVVTVFRDDLAPICWWIAAILELGTEWILTHLPHLAGRNLVPVNIEHSKDRLNCLVLIMMGETVINATLTYKKAREEHEEEEAGDSEDGHHEPSAENEGAGDSFYAVMSLGFAFIFIFTLLYFHMQPPASTHAFRQSRWRGTLMILSTKLLGLAMLSMGVGVKIMIEDVVHRRSMSIFVSRLMGLSAGSALLMLFAIRALHFGGHLPRPDDPPPVRRLFLIWWWTFGVASVLPFGIVATGRLTDPVSVTSTYTGLIAVLCVMESWYTHLLMEHLPGEDGSEEEKKSTGSGEREPLQHSVQRASYKT